MYRPGINTGETGVKQSIKCRYFCAAQRRKSPRFACRKPCTANLPGHLTPFEAGSCPPPPANPRADSSKQSFFDKLCGESKLSPHFLLIRHRDGRRLRPRGSPRAMTHRGQTHEKDLNGTHEFPRPCLKNVNMPKRRFFSRHTALIFLAIHKVLPRQIALSGEKIPRRRAHFQFSNKA